MRTVLICHSGDRIGEDVLTRWLSTFSTLAGVILIAEDGSRMRQRIKREIKRIGLFRFVDVLAFRIYYRLFLAKSDTAWETKTLEKLLAALPALPADLKILRVTSPNCDKVKTLINDIAPDLTIARCKTLLKKSVWNAAKHGTFVMHPGICPEYRNAHGCFWALANDDRTHVGMTLLKIDAGIDTGPVHAYYYCEFDEKNHSPTVIQNKVVLDNLDAMREKLIAVTQGQSTPIDTSGRLSREWGQPWMSMYLKMQKRAKLRAKQTRGE